ncbi:hypothetical protein [Winogradskyella sp. 3972H.M.0a.05]|uniref:hypothetical protein n=1 Tax=Winogradskyella sp. 3972H.M.0a.05 TaxID=2950277 RepID=UPI00339B0DD3
MTVEKSPLFTLVQNMHEINIGKLYFFDTFVIAEFNEGENIGFDNFYEAHKLIKQYFDDRPFGFIANRINSYSIILPDAEQFNKAYPNLKAYAIVTERTITKKIFEIENHFFKFNRELFSNVDDAITWTEMQLKAEALL